MYTHPCDNVHTHKKVCSIDILAFEEVSPVESQHIFAPFVNSILPYVRRRAFLLEAATFVFALLLGRVELFKLLLPFGAAFVAAIDIAGHNVYYPFAGAMIGSLLAGEAGYPALAGTALYLVLTTAYRFFKKRARRQDKLFVLAATQILLLPMFYIGSSADALRGLATAALTLLLCVAFQNGIRALKAISIRNTLREEEQISLCMLLGALSLSVSDASLYAFSLGVVVAAWSAMFIAYAKGLPAVAAAVVLGGMLILGGKAQPLLLANLAICTLAGVFCRSMGIWGIVAGFGIACAVTDVYGSVSGMQVGMVNFVPASLLLLVLPKPMLLSLRAVVDAGAREERTARAALLSLQSRAAEDITRTASTVEQISSLFPEEPLWTYTLEQEHGEMIRAAMHICGDCNCRGACWKDRDAATEALTGMLPAAAQGLRPRAIRPFPPDCAHTVQLAAAALQAQESYRTRCMELHRAASRHAFAHRQLRGVSRVMQRIAADVSQADWPAEGAAQTLMRRMGRDGYPLRGALVQKRHGALFAQLKLSQSTPRQAAQWEEAVSRALDAPMRLLTERKERHGTVLEFEQARKLKASMAAATLPMHQSPVSGDSTAEARLPSGRALFALSDGMGSGVAAREESARTLSLLLRLYQAGFERDAALECVNRLLMQQNEAEMYATVDALHIDLSTGETEFIKFGAQPSFVLREGRVHTVYAEALPAGILDEAAPAVHTATLRRNDAVVLLTDGALDALGEDTEAEILSCVGGANTCEDAARALLYSAHDHGAEDDMTVMVVRLA